MKRRERLDADEILAAYRGHPDVGVARHRYVEEAYYVGRTLVKACCGASILLLDEHPNVLSRLRYMSALEARKTLARLLGPPIAYCIGFVDGWDGHPAYHWDGSHGDGGHGAVVGFLGPSDTATRGRRRVQYLAGLDDGRVAWDGTRAAPAEIGATRSPDTP